MASRRDRLVGNFAQRNVSKASPRFGQRFKVVTKGGVRYHDYGGGRLIRDVAAPPRTIKPVPAPTGRRPMANPPGAAALPTEAQEKAATPKYPSAYGRQGPAPLRRFAPGMTPQFTSAQAERDWLRRIATGRGPQLNVSEVSPRYGQRFRTVSRAGTRYHVYGAGRRFADIERGAGTARFRRRRKPAATTPVTS
jgi:hypothetical protein